MYVMTQDERSHWIECEKQGGTADKVYSSLVVKATRDFSCVIRKIEKRRYENEHGCN